MAARRVVYVSDGAWYGGAERYLVRLGAHLDRSRFTPVLLLPKQVTLEGFAGDARAAGFDVLEAAPGRVSGFRDPMTLLQSLRSLKPDILHLNFPSLYDLGCGWVAGLGRQCGARAVVTTEHIVDIGVSRRRALARRTSYRWVDRFIAISEANRRIMVERHGVPERRTRVILNGVEDPGPPPGRPAQPFVIACVGSLEARKGQELLLRVLSRLLERGSDARLTFVGDGPGRSDLEADTRRSGLESHVRFAGHVASAGDEIRAAHVLAVPSVLEGIPFVVLEGMAGGAVIVSSDLPGIGEVLDPGRSGVILGSRDPEVWAAALAGLDADRGHLGNMARAARTEFEHRFRAERMARETEALYQEVPE